ncbi:MAG: hypothetical protein ACKVJK_20075, partial [Methylophagaceae bacterium]
FTLSGSPAVGLDFSTPGTGNTLTVSMTVTGDTSNLNDVESLSGIVVYTPRTPSLSTTASTICQGGNVTYTILLDGSSTPVATATYTFKLNGAVVQQIMGTNTMTFGAGATAIANGDKITIDVIDGQSSAFNGCIVNTSTISETITVSVPPVATLVSNSTPSLTVCAGDNITFTAGPSGSGETYQFFKGGSAASAAEVSTNVYTTAITASGTIKVIVTNSAGCTSSRTIVVSVPLLSNGGAINIAGIADLNICPLDPLPNIGSTTAASTNTTLSSPGSLVTYQWQTRTGEVWQDIDGATTETYVAAATPVTLNATTEVRRLAFASINGVICPTGGTPAALNATFNVDVDRLPAITLNDADNTVCASAVTGLTFTATTASPTATDSFQWVINNTNVGGAVVGASATYTPAAGDLDDGDVVKVRVTTAAPFGCTYTSAAGSGITININDEPVANLSNNTGGTNTICSGESVIFTATNGGVNAGETYAFTLNGSTVNAAHVVGNVYTAPVGTILAEAVVGVTVTKNGCSDSTTLTILVPTITAGSINAPADVEVCLGVSSGNITSGGVGVAGGSAGGALSYQWQTRIDVATGWVPVSGATAAALTIGGAVQ